MDPRVTGGAKLFERFAIGVGEMKCVRDMNRTVVFCGRFGNGELSGFVVEFRNAAVSEIMPWTDGWCHEANAVGPIAIVEAGHVGR